MDGVRALHIEVTCSAVERCAAAVRAVRRALQQRSEGPAAAMPPLALPLVLSAAVDGRTATENNTLWPLHFKERTAATLAVSGVDARVFVFICCRCVQMRHKTSVMQ
jgi:hypothetical protein